MSKFTVETHVETLDYDFTTCQREDGKGYCKGKGRLPEPSHEDLAEYQDAMQELLKNTSLEGLTKGGSAEARAQLEATLDAFDTLCKGSPSKDELMELPPRVLMHFIKWVGKQFSDPEV